MLGIDQSLDVVVSSVEYVAAVDFGEDLSRAQSARLSETSRVDADRARLLVLNGEAELVAFASTAQLNAMQDRTMLLVHRSEGRKQTRRDPLVLVRELLRLRIA